MENDGSTLTVLTNDLFSQPVITPSLYPAMPPVIDEPMI